MWVLDEEVGLISERRDRLPRFRLDLLQAVRFDVCDEMPEAEQTCPYRSACSPFTTRLLGARSITPVQKKWSVRLEVQKTRRGSAAWRLYSPYHTVLDAARTIARLRA